MISIEEYKLLQSAHPEFVIQPLSAPDDTNKNPGKRAFLPAWEQLKKTPDNIGEYLKKGCNLGLVCGSASNTIVLDFDSETFYKTLFPEGSNTLEDRRTEGRRHVYFRYTPLLLSKSDTKLLHIEIQSDKKNLVLPPSIHASGDLYHWIKPNVPIRELTTDEIKNINDLFNISNELKELLKSCGNCFGKLLEIQPNMDTGEDRPALLGLFAELKLNGASDGLLRFVSKLIFKEKYNKKDTDEGLKHIDVKKPHKCDSLRNDFGKYFKFDVDGVSICSNCERWRRMQDKEGKGKKKAKEPAQLPPIPIEAINETPINIEELLKTYKKYLYVEEDIGITIPLSEVISNFAPIEPDIMGIIGASGSSKTEIIRALGELENQFVYPVSSITSHTLISGLEDNIDLAPMLRGRLLTIKDFTTILAKNKDMVSEIFADLRELTDGHIGKDFGSGVKKHYTGIHTSVLFGCTNAIEAHNSVHSVLGQRILYFRPKNDKRKAMQQARKNSGIETQIRDELHKTTLQLVNTMIKTQSERLKNLTKHLTDEQNTAIEDLAFFLAIVRTHINRDFRGDMATLPEPEYPTRLAKTICKLVDAHSLLYNREPNNTDMIVAYRLTLDNIPTERLKVLSVMLDGNERTTSEVQEQAKLPTTTARRILDDLKTLEIIEYFSMGHGNADVWQLSNGEYREILTKLVKFSKPQNNNPSTDSDEVRGEIRQGGYMSVSILKGTPEIFNNKIEKPIDTHLTELHPTPNHDAVPQQKIENIENCGFCGNPLNGNSEDLHLPGLGRTHPSCKREMWTIKALHDVPTFVCIDEVSRSIKADEVKSIPAYNAIVLINRKMAVRVEA